MLNGTQSKHGHPYAQGPEGASGPTSQRFTAVSNPDVKGTDVTIVEEYKPRAKGTECKGKGG